MIKLKEIKLVKKLKNVKPRLKWLMFSQMQDYKINSNYIDLICPNTTKTATQDHDYIESMVKETLIKEFSPEIQNLKSYDFLVDSIVNKLKQKQLEQWDKSTDVFVV